VNRRALAIAIVLGGACRPDLGPSDGLVTKPAILAIRADPPEADPGASATYTALVALPEGMAASSPVVWRFCSAPKPLTTDNAVAAGCFDASSLVAAGSGSSTVASTALDACSLFGPETPARGARPRDPDDTGGYYQPLRADLSGADPTFYLVRLLCGLGSAAADTVAEFAQRYVPNANPHLLPLTADVDGASVSLSQIHAGPGVALHASWPAGDAETYVDFDPDAQTLSTRRESMRVAWNVTAGDLAAQSTGRAETDFATSTDDTWIAPRRAGRVTLWVVLRDSRGGIDFASYDVTVTP
jgi:hypothetical protein